MTPALTDSAAAAPAGGVRCAARRSGAGETVAAALSASPDPLVSVSCQEENAPVEPNRSRRAWKEEDGQRHRHVAGRWSRTFSVLENQR